MSTRKDLIKMNYTPIRIVTSMNSRRGWTRAWRQPPELEQRVPEVLLHAVVRSTMGGRTVGCVFNVHGCYCMGKKHLMLLVFSLILRLIINL